MVTGLAGRLERRAGPEGENKIKVIEEVQYEPALVRNAVWKL